MNDGTSWGPLRAEIKASNREKLELAGLALNRTPNELVNVLIGAVKEIEIREIITIKLKPEPGSVAAEEGHKTIVIKKTQTLRHTF